MCSDLLSAANWPHRLWAASSYLFSLCGGIKQPGSEAAYHIRLVLKVRMREAVPPVPHMPFWLA